MSFASDRSGESVGWEMQRTWRGTWLLGDADGVILGDGCDLPCGIDSEE